MIQFVFILVVNTLKGSSTSYFFTCWCEGEMFKCSRFGRPTLCGSGMPSVLQKGSSAYNARVLLSTKGWIWKERGFHDYHWFPHSSDLCWKYLTHCAQPENLMAHSNSDSLCQVHCCQISHQHKMHLQTYRKMSQDK